MRRRPLLLLAASTLPAIRSLAGSTEAPELRAEREALTQFLAETLSGDHSFTDRFDAQVWLLDMSNRLRPFIANPEARLRLLRQVHGAASAAGLPPELVLAVIEVESGFDRFAVSSAGAQGLMQVMPFWREELGRPDDNLTDNATNLEYGCRILQFYLVREDGHLHRALAAYNGSSGSRRYGDRVQRAWARRWRTRRLPW